MVYGGGLIPAVHHAVGTLRIARLRAVVFPVRRVHQFLEGVRVAVLQQITRFLPAEDVVRGHSPRGTSIVALAHQEFEEKRRLVEFPTLVAVGQNGTEQPPCARTTEEMLLVRGLIVGVARRKHHAFDANLHHFVEESTDTLGSAPSNRVVFVVTRKPRFSASLIPSSAKS